MRVPRPFVAWERRYVGRAGRPKARPRADGRTGRAATARHHAAKGQQGCGHGSVHTAIGAIRAGAFDFHVKPVAPRRSRAPSHAVERNRVANDVRGPRASTAVLRGARRLLGQSVAMAGMREVVARVGPTRASVLITARQPCRRRAK